jgi:hypothetical protein
MRHLQFWLNEEEYEKLKREAEKKGLTTYALIKSIVTRRKQMLMLGYLLLLYSAASTAIIIYLILQLLTITL